MLGMTKHMLVKITSASILLGAILAFCFGYIPSTTTQFSNKYQNFVSIDGIIAEDVDARKSLQLITLKPDNYSEYILLQYRGYAKFEYGDRVWVKGKLEKPQPFNGFDYPHYLQTKNVSGLIKNPKVIVLKKHQGNRVIHYIYSLKHYVTETIEERISFPENQVVMGMLIGADKNIPEEIMESFRQSGVSHVLSVSGYNIGIITLLMGEWLAKLIGRRRSFIFLAFLVCIFTLITGAGASVVRASIMGLALCLARVSGRPYSQSSIILFTGGVMVLLNPLILFYDPGFQLSFLATLGIIYLSPFIGKVFKNQNSSFALLITSTLSATIATLPLTLYYFGTFSFLSLFANLVILPLVPLIMLAGFLSLIPFLGYGFGFIASLVLQVVIPILNTISGVEIAKVQFSINIPYLICSYLLMFFAYIFIVFRKKNHYVKMPER